LSEEPSVMLMSEDEPRSKSSRSAGRWQFGLRSLFVLTFVVALYSSAVAAESDDVRFFLLLMATFVLVGIFGIRYNRAAWLGFFIGGAVGFVWWWCADHIEPFLDRDARFYLVVYASLLASAGMLAGFVWSVRTKAREDVADEPKPAIDADE